MDFFSTDLGILLGTFVDFFAGVVTRWWDVLTIAGISYTSWLLAFFAFAVLVSAVYVFAGLAFPGLSSFVGGVEAARNKGARERRARERLKE